MLLPENEGSLRDRDSREFHEVWDPHERPWEDLPWLKRLDASLIEAREVVLVQVGSQGAGADHAELVDHPELRVRGSSHLSLR